MFMKDGVHTMVSLRCFQVRRLLHNHHSSSWVRILFCYPIAEGKASKHFLHSSQLSSTWPVVKRDSQPEERKKINCDSSKNLKGFPQLDFCHDILKRALSFPPFYLYSSHTFSTPHLSFFFYKKKTCLQMATTTQCWVRASFSAFVRFKHSVDIYLIHCALIQCFVHNSNLQNTSRHEPSNTSLA